MTSQNLKRQGGCDLPGQFLRDIAKAQDIDQLVMAGQHAIEALGCLYFAFTNALPNDGDFASMPFMTSLPADTIARIAQLGVLSNNAVLQRMRERRQSDVVDFAAFDAASVPGQVGRVLSELGISKGALIPVVSQHDLVAVITAYAPVDRDLEALVPALTILGSAISLRLMLILDSAESSPHLGLSEQQNLIMSWVSAGKSNADIATILGITPRVCAWHLSEVYRKLGVSSRAQAISVMGSRLP